MISDLHSRQFSTKHFYKDTKVGSGGIAPCSCQSMAEGQEAQRPGGPDGACTEQAGDQDEATCTSECWDLRAHGCLIGLLRVPSRGLCAHQ